MRRSTIPLVLLALVTFFAGLGRGAIADSDEAFYAESAREMVESGDWLTPHFNDEQRFQKPVFYYWLTAALYLVTGPTEISARFWAALSGVGLVLVTAACGRRWFDEDTGLLAGAITATNFGYFALARMALPDLPLALFVTVAISATFAATLERTREPRWWLLIAAAAAALGFLTKGPLALVLPMLVVLPVLLIERRSFDLDLVDVLLAALLFAAIAAPWYLAMWTEHGFEYLRGFFVGDNLERFATTRYNDPRPWWFYLPIIAGGLLPWAPLMTVWLGPTLQFVTRRRDISTIELRLLLWAALPFVFFTLSIGKQPRYVLPLLPPLAILLASSIIERTREWRSLDGVRRRPRPNLAVVVGSVLSGLSLCGLAIGLYRLQPLFINITSTLTLTLAVVIAMAGLAVILVSISRFWRTAPAVLACSAAVSFAVLPYATLSAPRDAEVFEMAKLVRDAHRHGEAIGTYRVFVRNLVFYTRLPHTDLIHDEHIQDWLGKNPRALIVMRTWDADRLEREKGWHFQRLAERTYFDDSSVRVRTVLAPDPTTDLEQVVLVRFGG